mmetsp:Transcript_38690/g.37036  ORF Transcript_38690/g.37036 Transcript_38690/m.37036 type:complete len:106 (-) Transcript_38690:335-652(-)
MNKAILLATLIKLCLIVLLLFSLFILDEASMNDLEDGVKSFPSISFLVQIKLLLSVEQLEQFPPDPIGIKLCRGVDLIDLSKKCLEFLDEQVILEPGLHLNLREF